MREFGFKHGFGLMEVLVAAVVLGFLIVGLNHLQKGNREAILRVRARDAANFVAQHILDSLGTVGLNSINKIDGGDIVFEKDLERNPYIYRFTGNNVGDVEINYGVRVELLNEDESTPNNDNDYTKIAVDSTQYTAALCNKTGSGERPPCDEEKNTYANSLEAEVSWRHGNSTQSIRMAKVVK